MRAKTSLILDDDLIARGMQYTGIRNMSELIRAGLKALIAREASKRLAALGGSEPRLRPIRRRRGAVFAEPPK